MAKTRATTHGKIKGHDKLLLKKKKPRNYFKKRKGKSKRRWFYQKFPTLLPRILDQLAVGRASIFTTRGIITQPTKSMKKRTSQETSASNEEEKIRDSSSSQELKTKIKPFPSSRPKLAPIEEKDFAAIFEDLRGPKNNLSRKRPQGQKAWEKGRKLSRRFTTFGGLFSNDILEVIGGMRTLERPILLRNRKADRLLRRPASPPPVKFVH